MTNHTAQKLKDRIRLYNAEEIHDKKFGEMQRQFEKIGKNVIQRYQQEQIKNLKRAPTMAFLQNIDELQIKKHMLAHNQRSSTQQQLDSRLSMGKNVKLQKNVSRPQENQIKEETPSSSEIDSPSIKRLSNLSEKSASSQSSFTDSEKTPLELYKDLNQQQRKTVRIEMPEKGSNKDIRKTIGIAKLQKVVKSKKFDFMSYMTRKFMSIRENQLHALGNHSLIPREESSDEYDVEEDESQNEGDQPINQSLKNIKLSKGSTMSSHQIVAM